MNMPCGVQSRINRYDLSNTEFRKPGGDVRRPAMDEQERKYWEKVLVLFLIGLFIGLAIGWLLP